MVADAAVTVSAHAQQISLIQYGAALTSANYFVNIHASASNVGWFLVMLSKHWARFAPWAFGEKTFH